MEYLADACEVQLFFNTKFETAVPAPEKRMFVLTVLIEIAQGLGCLHLQNIFHCDLKLGNVLVGRMGTEWITKITDFGFSKATLDGGRVEVADQTTRLFTTLDYLPKRFRRAPYMTSDAGNPDRVTVRIPKAELTAQFDLHYVGGILSRLLDMPLVAGSFEPHELAYLRRMIVRMNLDSPKEIHSYRTSQEVLADLRKLHRSYLGAAGVPELSSFAGGDVLRLPVMEMPSSTSRRIIDHPWFARLQVAAQLGLTYFVFPGATHTRFEHSLGVYAQAAEYMQALLSNTATPHFRQLVSEEMLETTLVAALLHDVAQHSFAHILEDDLNYSKHEGAARAFLTGDGIGDFLPKGLASCEPLGDVIHRGWPNVRMPMLLWMVARVQPSGQVITPAEIATNH